MATITYTGTLIVTSCWCGIRLAIPDDLYDFAERTGKSVYCPVGHSFVYRDHENKRLKEENERLTNRLTRERAARDQAETDAEHQRRRVQGYQGALGKAKKRAAAGVCPVAGCKRSFADLARHVTKQHPKFAPEATEEVVVE